MEKKSRVLTLDRIQLLLFIIVTILGIYSFYLKNFRLITIAVFGVWLTNFLFCCLKIKERLLFFWLQITIAVFLLGKPLIQTIEGKKWWKVDWLDEKSIYTALLIIGLSLGCMYLGARFVSWYMHRDVNKKNKQDTEDKKAFRDVLQVVSMISFYLTAIFCIVEGAEKVLFVHNNSYLDYYSSFVSQLPGFVLAIASLMKYCLCIFLATYPRKLRAFLALALFEITAVLDLAVGIRGTIVLNSIFIIVYYLIRDFYNDKERWFGKIERGLVAIGVPVMFIFMTAYASLRAGLRIMESNPLILIKDFFVSQGVSFEVVARGISVMDKLPQGNGRNYTFGAIIDYIVHGRIGQALFGTEALPSGNNIINGTESNSMAHNLSYLTRGEEYLQGKGWGSSYVLETYVDFGYAGVIIFSLILGVLLLWGMYMLRKSVLMDTIIFVSLLGVFYIPRAEATGWIAFVITLQFWLCIGACYLATYVSVKVPVISTIYTKLRLMPNYNYTSKKEKLVGRQLQKKYKILIFLAIISIVCIGLNMTNKNELGGEVICSVQTEGAEYEGRRVTLKAKPEKGNGDYLFQFSETYNGKEKVVQEYSERDTYTFITEGLGNHTFYIDIKDGSGKKGILTYNLNITKRP